MTAMLPHRNLPPVADGRETRSDSRFLDATPPQGEDPDMDHAAPVDNEELGTPRLSLRRPTYADIDAIHRIHSDPRAHAHNPADALSTRAEAEERYRRWDGHWNQHGFGYWTVHGQLRNQQPLGFCGIKLMRLHDRAVLNLFYRLDPLAWGNGIATEAATAVVDWATAHLPEHPVIARVRPDNAASLQVAAHAGLRRAPHLDTDGEDGLDWIFTVNWPGNAEPVHDDPRP
ncbi:GNAT family N-acetyltransferase [Micromonospora sp. DT233]|uniref:GNAT family N-acetyltransferase n=1 Tax=Micromonospora sp. DT233 TaxID=3393432 RepID=UPI003CF3B0B1